MTKQKIIAMPWSLAQLWNETAIKPQKQLIARDYIYASEIGQPYIDRYYKMKATPRTNPPNSRSLRKFLAGNIWEHVVKQILICCGVYKLEQLRLDATPYEGYLSVHGKLDYKAGGYVDRNLALEQVEELRLPLFLHEISRKIIDKLAGGFLEYKILELKAISSFAMDLVERRRKAIPYHLLQGYHYQKFGKLTAEIAYICKDDCRMAQFGLDKKECEKLYRQDIEEMSYFFLKKKLPPKEPLAKFDNITGRFNKHLGVEYSEYLTMVYGFKNPDEYRDSVKFVEKWNRALTRFAAAETGKTTPTGKPIVITTRNIECRDEIVKAGFKFFECLKCRIAAGISEEEIE